MILGSFACETARAFGKSFVYSFDMYVNIENDDEGYERIVLRRRTPCGVSTREAGIGTVLR